MGKIASTIARLPALVGPLFTKELLVTSRRARYYMLRLAYASVLGLVIALAWLAFLDSARGSNVAWSITHMSEMGKQIISFIVCFQFGMAQVVAIVLLSSAVSEEIYQRTLVPILTTPMSYWQIVMGKFLGKLLHVGLLLAISLPLLGMVRVLGGVPWGYVLAGVCMTVTAAMITGAVALFFSVLCQRAYLSILASLGVSVCLYGMVGLVLVVISAILQGVTGSTMGWNVVLYLNPVAAMTYLTLALNDASKRVAGFCWPIHCLAMLGVVFGLLKLCEVLVRRTALRKAIGFQSARVDIYAAPVAVPVTATSSPVLMPVDPTAQERANLGQAYLGVAVMPAPAEPRRRWKPKGWDLKEVVGSPIVWRELRKPLLRDKVVQIIATCAALFYLLYTYAFLGASGMMGDGATQATFVAMFLLAGMLCAAIDSATTIAPEKQARTWPSLLSTPVSDWHILMGKAGGTAFRCLPVWLFLAGHVLIFTIVGSLHPIALLHLLLLSVSMMVFLVGAGVYFSTLSRRATSAVLLNVGLPVLLWAVLPAGATLIGQVFGDHELSESLAYINPVHQAAVLAAGACRRSYVQGHLYFRWPAGGAGWAVTTGIVAASAVGYSALGLLLAWRAKKIMRRNVFEA
jgi:ABC-type transport system involved in multi-copper enzyme maturation permease subunit